MAETSSRPPSDNAGSIAVGPQFCVPHPVDLTFTKTAPGVKRGHLAVIDNNGAVTFEVKGRSLSIRKRKLLIDAVSGYPLVSIQKKLWTSHGRWHVFIGDSSDPKDLLFSIRRSSMVVSKLELDVFSANNTSEEVCDFKIKGSYHNRSCIIYKGDSSVVVAQMSKHKVRRLKHGKDAFGVTINPNYDSCFVTALVGILHEFRPEAKTAVEAAISSIAALRLAL